MHASPVIPPRLDVAQWTSDPVDVLTGVGGVVADGVLWMCPATGVDPASPSHGVAFTCVHTLRELAALAGTVASSTCRVVVLDALPVEPFGYDPAVMAAEAAAVLERSPTHVVYVVRHAQRVVTKQAQTAFALEAHDLLCPDAPFLLEPGTRFDVTANDLPDEEPATARRAEIGDPTAALGQGQVKGRSPDVRTRWQEIAMLAISLVRGTHQAGALSTWPEEPIRLLESLHAGTGGLSPAARAVLLALVDGAVPSAEPLAAATGYAEVTVRRAVKEAALIRNPAGGGGSHWTMTTAAGLARDYGPWLASWASRGHR